jgi:hypothetical protein
MGLPSMKASQATELASRFARHLAAELDGVNRKYPAAELGSEFQDIMAQAHAGTLPGPTPADCVPIFEQLFYTYMASQYVIVPDQP